MSEECDFDKERCFEYSSPLESLRLDELCAGDYVQLILQNNVTNEVSAVTFVVDSDGEDIVETVFLIESCDVSEVELLTGPGVSLNNWKLKRVNYSFFSDQTLRVNSPITSHAEDKDIIISMTAYDGHNKNNVNDRPSVEELRMLQKYYFLRKYISEEVGLKCDEDLLEEITDIDSLPENYSLCIYHPLKNFSSDDPLSSKLSHLCRTRYLVVGSQNGKRVFWEYDAATRVNNLVPLFDLKVFERMDEDDPDSVILYMCLSRW